MTMPRPNRLRNRPFSRRTAQQTSDAQLWDKEVRKWMLGSLVYAGFWAAIVSHVPEGNALYYLLSVGLVLTLGYGVAQVLRGRYTVAVMILAFMSGSELLFKVFIPYNRYLFLSYFTVACGLGVFVRSLLLGRILPKNSGLALKFFLGYTVVSGVTLIISTNIFHGAFVLMTILSGMSIILLLTDFRPNYLQTMRIIAFFCMGQLSFAVACFYFWSTGYGGSRLTLPGKGSNEIGMLIGAGFMGCVVLYYHARSSLSRALIGISATVSVFALYLTQTRGAIVAVALSTLLIILLTATNSFRRFAASVVIIGILSFTLILAEEKSEGRLSHRFEAARSGAMGGRTRIWIPALHQTLKRPFIGHGLGSFVYEIGGFLKIGGKSAHNELIRVGYETGFLGALLFLAWHIAIITKTLTRQRRDPLFAMRIGLFAYVVISGLSISYRSRWTYLFFALTFLGWVAGGHLVKRTRKMISPMRQPRRRVAQTYAPRTSA